jgi:hypothetical protein
MRYHPSAPSSVAMYAACPLAHKSTAFSGGLMRALISCGAVLVLALIGSGCAAEQPAAPLANSAPASLPASTSPSGTSPSSAPTPASAPSSKPPLSLAAASPAMTTAVTHSSASAPSAPSRQPVAPPAPVPPAWCTATASVYNAENNWNNVYVHSNQPRTDATASADGYSWTWETDSSGYAVIWLTGPTPGTKITVKVGGATCTTSD